MVSARCFVPVIDRAIEDVEEGIEQAYYRQYCCKGASSDPPIINDILETAIEGVEANK